MTQRKIAKNLIAIMSAAKRLNAEVTGKINKKKGDMEINIFVDKMFPPKGHGIMYFSLGTTSMKALRAKYLEEKK